MTTRTDASTLPEHETPPWHRLDWTGPRVEVRPTDAGPEWPKDATERVVFLREEYPEYPFQQDLPAIAYFGSDGWPLTTPEAAKPKLDPRCQAELHRYPWSASREPLDEFTWIHECGSFENFLRFNHQALLLTGRRVRESGARLL